MAAVWSEESKYDKWLLIELAVSEAWADEGVVPAEDMEKLRSASYDIGRLREILEVTRHDMTAFLTSITEKLGPEGRWLHLGLTTSDVWDTATGLQLVEAAELLDREVTALIDVLEQKALEHKDTMMMAEPTGCTPSPSPSA